MLSYNYEINKRTSNTKNKENKKRIFDEYLLNEEAIPVQNNIPYEMNCHPEGEYILKEDGVYLCYVVREEKSCGDNKQDDNKEINV